MRVSEEEAWKLFAMMPEFRGGPVELMKDFGTLVTCERCANPECIGWHYEGVYVPFLRAEMARLSAFEDELVNGDGDPGPFRGLLNS